MESHCVGENYTIQEVLESFDKNHERVALVVNDANKVIGVVSQGDIIHALSAGKSVYANVSGIINNSFLYLKDKDIKKAYEIFKKKNITMIPVVDDDYMLKDVIVMEDIYNYTDSFMK